MKNGKWYFVFTKRDKSRPGTNLNEELPLKATTEDEAIAEGERRWKKVYARAMRLWKMKTKASGGISPTPRASSDGPWCPRVIYRINLGKSTL